MAITQLNGPRPRMSSGRNRETLTNLASKQDVQARLRRGGGNRDVSAAVEKMRQVRRPTTPSESPQQRTPLSIGVANPPTGDGGASVMNSLQAALTAAVAASQRTGGGALPAGVRAQLIRGFRDAGRDDLANMVRTRAFDTWIGKESGWQTHVVSPANNHGLRNGGLFQIWYGHDFSNKYERPSKFTASPYQQAQLVSQYFPHLDPADIRRYARLIRAGNYVGWG